MRTVVYQEGAAELAEALLGRRVLDNDLLARAVGALDGSEVVFSVRRDWLMADITP